MANRTPDYFPRRIDQHVPDMSYSADAVHSGPLLVNLGTPIAADPDYFLTARTATSGAATVFLNAQFTKDSATSSPYGACVDVTSSATNTANQVLLVQGRDYLGQVMTETLLIPATATTTTGVKAFKYLDSVRFGTGAYGGTLSVGQSNKQGLPYRTMNVGVDVENYATVGTGGTFVACLSTGTTGTATTVDSRGTWSPGDVADGATVYQLECYADQRNIHGATAYFSATL